MNTLRMSSFLHESPRAEEARFMRDGVVNVHNSQIILVLYGNVGINPASSSSLELISLGILS
jgi:hypothetical protein